MKLPSEHVYIRRAELRILVAAVKKINGRLAGAKLGSFPHQFPLERIDPQQSARIYSGRRYDQELADQFQSLQNRLTGLGTFGKLRLNLTHVTALAFALRRNREAETKHGARVKQLEARLENLRRRLKRATVRKLSHQWYASYVKRWSCFVQWIRYNLLYDRGRIRFTHPSAIRKLNQEQLEAVEAWVSELIEERCEKPLPAGELPGLAEQTKRHARLRRFPSGVSLREMLNDRSKYNDEVFAYLRRHVSVELKWQYLDLSRRQGRLGERFRAALVVQPDDPELRRSETNEEVSTNTTNVVPRGSQLPQCESPVTHTEPGLTRSSISSEQVDTGSSTREMGTIKEELVKGVGKFFLRVDLSCWNAIAEETVRQARSFHPPEYTDSPFPFWYLVETAQAPQPDPVLAWCPFDLSDDQLFWEVDWLLENLCRWVAPSEIPEIIQKALQGAKTTPESSA